MAQPDSKKIFFENLSGAGKAIAVLTSGGDAQGKTAHTSGRCDVVNSTAEADNTRLTSACLCRGRPAVCGAMSKGIRRAQPLIQEACQLAC